LGCYYSHVGLRRWIVLSLGVATFATYSAVGGHEFVNYDDRVYILENPQLREPVTLSSVALAFQPYESNWIPFTWLSLLLDFTLFGASAPAFLRTNVLLHAASAILLFLALARMTGALWRSAFVAAVFALHPLHVESVAWVSERKDVLSGFFWMIALWAYAGYVEHPASRRRYAAVFLCLAAGLLSKPIAVTLPIALLLLDYWPLNRLSKRDERRRALLEKIPLVTLCIAVSAITLWVQRESHTMFFADHLSAATRIANAFESIAAYLTAAFWPSGLAAFYPYPLNELSGPRAGALALLFLFITLLFLRAAKSAPYGIVGWSWFIVTLGPTLGLVQVGLQGRADRYMYIPLIGIALVVAWGTADLIRERIPQKKIAAGVGAAACVALAIVSSLQVDHWRNTLALFEHAAAVTSGNYYSENAIAGVHLEASRFDAAERHYRESIRMDPKWAESHLGLANVFVARRDLENAVAEYRIALDIYPDHPVAHFQLGILLLNFGQSERALTHLKSAEALARTSVQLDAQSAELAASLGVALARLGSASEAVTHLEAAVSRRPGLTVAKAELAWVLATSGDLSVRDPVRALRLTQAFSSQEAGESNRARNLDVLAAALAATGRYEDAVAMARRAAQLARERNNHALLRGVEGRIDLYESGRPYIISAFRTAD